MTAPGWYPDPAEPEVRRYWDGEQWIGDGVPVDAPVPVGPPVAAKPRYGAEAAPAEAVSLTKPGVGGLGAPPYGPGAPGRPGPGYPPSQGFPAGGGAGLPLGALPGDVPVQKMATLGERLAARVLDILFVTLLNMVVNGWFIYQYYEQYLRPMLAAALQAYYTGQPAPTSTQQPYTLLSLVITLIALALWFAYEVPSVWNTGQTLGKRLVGIRVQFLLDHPMTFGLSMRRWWVQSLTVLCWPFGLIIGAVDALWCTWDQPRRQCLHDKAVATIVVRNDAPRPPAQDKPAEKGERK